MQWKLLTGILVATIGLGGCFGGDEGTQGLPAYEGQVRDIELVIKAATADTIPLYTLNDGNRTMNVVAMGFTEKTDDPTVLPNPMIRVREGDTVRLTVTNYNPLPHTFHLHGGLVNWTMDGVPFLSQAPLHQGESYTYIFEDIKAGTYFYHCHVDVAHHMDLGMYGAFIVEEMDDDRDRHTFADPADPIHGTDFVLMLDEWDNCHVHGNADPVTGAENNGEFSNRADCIERFSQDILGQNQQATSGASSVPDEVRDPLCESYPTLPQEVKDELEPVYRQLNCDDGHFTPPPQQEIREWYPAQFPVYSPTYNTYLINGKAFPDTKPIYFEEGSSYRIRMINVGEEWHSMHIHGHKYLVTHKDGFKLDSPYYADTLSIGPGERYDVEVEADNPGFWAFHDHVALNVMNDAQSPGGMFTVIGYTGAFAEMHEYDPMLIDRSIELYDVAQAAYGGNHNHG